MNAAKQDKLIKSLAALLFLALLGTVLIPPFLRAQNDVLVTTDFEISSGKLPASFDGYTLAVISDLHSKQFGTNNDLLIKQVDAANPDAVLICGDTLVGNDRTDTGHVFLTLCITLVRKYPVYMVYGNHEQRRFDLNNIDDTYKKAVENAGAQVISGNKITLAQGSDNINLYGLDLPYIYYRPRKGQGFLHLLLPDTERYFAADISKVLGTVDSTQYNILLTHNPIKLAAYADWGADLVLAGHGHGGIINLPLFGGLATPFASTSDMTRYDAGLFSKGSTQLIVSRGMGSAAIPCRIFNKPELVVVHLKSGG